MNHGNLIQIGVVETTISYPRPHEEVYLGRLMPSLYAWCDADDVAPLIERITGVACGEQLILGTSHQEAMEWLAWHCWRITSEVLRLAIDGQLSRAPSVEDLVGLLESPDDLVRGLAMRLIGDAKPG